MCLTDAQSVLSDRTANAHRSKRNRGGGLTETHAVNPTYVKKGGDAWVPKIIRLFIFLFKKRFVDAARGTHPVVGKRIKWNALNFFIVDPFTNTANPFCQLASPNLIFAVGT